MFHLKKMIGKILRIIMQQFAMIPNEKKWHYLAVKNYHHYQKE